MYVPSNTVATPSLFGKEEVAHTSNPTLIANTSVASNAPMLTVVLHLSLTRAENGNLLFFWVFEVELAMSSMSGSFASFARAMLRTWKSEWIATHVWLCDEV